MPHRGHTTIEMTPHRQGGERHAPHENPRAHESPVIIPPRSSRSPSPSHNRRHNDVQPHHDNNHLSVASALHPNLTNGSNHHTTPAGHHTNGARLSNPHGNSHENLEHSSPEDSTPLLHRTRRDVSATPAEDDSKETVATTTDLVNPGLTLDMDAANSGQPIKESGAASPRPPLAGPETDDLDEENRSTGEFKENDDAGHTQFGITDELHDTNLPWNGTKDGEDLASDEGDGLARGVPYGMTPRFGADSPFPYAPEFAPGSVPPSDVNVNVYQQKKNLAQGMMDLALLSANANQLRYVLEAGNYHPYFYPSLIFIIMSLILQIGVGCGLYLNSKYDIKDAEDLHKANNINNYTVIGVFLITVVNIFLGAFVVQTSIGVGVGLIINSTYDIKDRYDICKADKINNMTVLGIFLVTVVNVFVASFGVAQMPPQVSSSTGT